MQKINLDEFIDDMPFAEAARSINGSHGNISMCCQGKRKTAYKFIWKYKN